MYCLNFYQTHGSFQLIKVSTYSSPQFFIETLILYSQFVFLVWKNNRYRLCFDEFIETFDFAHSFCRRTIFQKLKKGIVKIIYPQ